jgi:uncharacterized protein YndB with AHSA1/START domain
VTVERTVEIEASPETVWELLTDPVQAQRWWGMNASFDPRPGGVYALRISPRTLAQGTFLEVDRPRRLVYSFGWAEGGDGPERTPPGSTTVEITLEPLGDGTKLSLVHRDLAGPEAAASHERGWEHYLSRLGVAARGEDPGPDPWAQ